MKHNKLISIDNKIVKASYKITLYEMRLILLAFSQINPLENGNESKIITISASQYSSWFGGENKAAYRDMKEALELLFERCLKVICKSDMKTGIRWIDLKSVIDSTQSIELRFTPEISDFLQNLRNGFTSYHLSNVCRMKSVFSIRLYQILMQWKSTGEVTITVENLRFTLDIPLKGYPTFGNIKQKIIVPAMLEINDVSDVKADYLLIKKGKFVHAIRFIFEFKKDGRHQPAVKDFALESIRNIKNNLVDENNERIT
jgi:plasmid replication initiation protein